MKKGILRAGLVLIPLLLCVWLLWAGVPVSTGEGRLVINEVMAKNLATIRDGDGRVSDWIELYNGSDRPIDLEGYGLSDRRDELYRWSFPAVTLGPGEYLLVFAAPEGSDPDTLYCGFGLDGRGETLYLTDRQGDPVDSLACVSLKYDVSYGRAANDPEALISFISPTPGRPNGAELGRVEQRPCTETVTFSHPSGSYEEPLALTLSCGKGTIVYTTDGSEPDRDSPIYLHPLTLQTSPQSTIHVIRAAVYDGKSMGDITTAFYLVGQESSYTLPVLCLAADPEELFGENGIWNSGLDGDLTDNTRIRGTVLFPGQEEGRPAGISLRGQGSRIYTKPKSLALTFGEPLTAEGRTYNQLRLRAEGTGEAYLHCQIDAYLLSLCRALDLGAAEGSFYNLFINGDYQGLYRLQESDDQSFFVRNYGVDPRELAVLKYSVQNTAVGTELVQKYGSEKDLEDYLAFYRWLFAADLTRAEDMAVVEDTIDLNSFTDYLAVEVFTANLDWPTHNVTLWRTSVSHEEQGYRDGRWRFTIYDLDNTFLPEALDYDEIGDILGKELDPADSVQLVMLLTQKLWAVPAYRERFLARCGELLEGPFALERMLAALDEQETLLAPDIPAYFRRLYVSPFHWEEDMARMRESIIARHQWFSQWAANGGT